MNCSDVRLALEAEPAAADPAVAAHLSTCPECANYSRELQAFDRRLRKALAVPVPPARPLAFDAAGPRRPARRSRFFGQLALAASVAAVAVVAGLLWVAFPRNSLAAAVVGHMSHEPSAWTSTRPLPAARVADVLGRRDVTLRPGAVDVTYAQACWFRGRFVPHLVVQTSSGPVTLMVLTHEPVIVRGAFDEGGYHGVLVPAPRGSLAVLGRGDTDVAAAAARALAALDYR